MRIKHGRKMSFKILIISSLAAKELTHYAKGHYDQQLVANNDTEALYILENNDIDIILLDMEMLHLFAGIKNYVRLHDIAVMLIDAKLAHESQYYQEKLGLLNQFDQLTGLYNKNYFNAVLGDLCEKLSQSNAPLALVMIDIDSFKSINDAQGHLAGDESLKEIALLLKKSIRNQDLLARFGGEEFILALPATEVSSAFTMIERIRNSIELELHVTASFGISAYKHGEAIDNLINRADLALYQAKLEGKNLVMLSRENLVT